MCVLSTRSDLLWSNFTISISTITLGAARCVLLKFTKLVAREVRVERSAPVSVVLDVYTWVTLRSDVGVTVDLSPWHGVLFFYFDLRYFRNLFSLTSFDR